MTLGAPEDLFTLEGNVMVSGFGPDGKRLLGMRLYEPPARRIIVETGWSPEG